MLHLDLSMNTINRAEINESASTYWTYLDKLRSFIDALVPARNDSFEPEVLHQPNEQLRQELEACCGRL